MDQKDPFDALLQIQVGLFLGQMSFAFLLSGGLVLLFSASNLAWSFHIFLSSCTASQPG